MQKVVSYYKAILLIVATSKVYVRGENGMSQWFEVSQGIRQGCALSPVVFNIFMD